MLNFTKFLTEAEHKMQLKDPSTHINHVADAILHQGHSGVGDAADNLDDAHQMLSGGKAKHDYQHKYDGAHPIVFGEHPHTKKFFVSSKEGGDKINHTPEDIVNNHANNPKLAGHLITALSELPKIMPKNAPGVFHGDYMHSPHEILNKDGHNHIKPRKMVYSAKEDSAEGANLKKNMGIVVHTMYGPDGHAMPIDKKTRSKFINHPDVHNIDPTFQAESGKYEPKEQNEYVRHRDAATKQYKTMKPESFDAVMAHSPDIMKHINDQIKAGEPYDAKSLINSLNANHSKRLEGISNEKWARQRNADHTSKTAHLLAHQTHVDKVLKLHKHLNDATGVLAKVMDKSNPWIHSIDGKVTPSEGVVSVNSKKGTAAKFVNRKEFSKAEKKAKKKNDK